MTGTLFASSPFTLHPPMPCHLLQCCILHQYPRHTYHHNHHPIQAHPILLPLPLTNRCHNHHYHYSSPPLATPTTTTANTITTAATTPYHPPAIFPLLNTNPHSVSLPITLPLPLPPPFTSMCLPGLLPNTPDYSPHPSTPTCLPPLQCCTLTQFGNCSGEPLPERGPSEIRVLLWGGVA